MDLSSPFVPNQESKRQTVISLFLYICSPRLPGLRRFMTDFLCLLKYNASFFYSLLNEINSTLHGILSPFVSDASACNIFFVLLSSQASQHSPIISWKEVKVFWILISSQISDADIKWCKPFSWIYGDLSTGLWLF